MAWKSNSLREQSAGVVCVTLPRGKPTQTTFIKQTLWVTRLFCYAHSVTPRRQAGRTSDLGPKWPSYHVTGPPLEGHQAGGRAGGRSRPAYGLSRTAHTITLSVLQFSFLFFFIFMPINFKGFFLTLVTSSTTTTTTTTSSVMV